MNTTRVVDMSSLGYLQKTNPEIFAPDITNNRQLYMNSVASAVLENGSYRSGARVGYCDAKLFGIAFFGELIEMPVPEDVSRLNGNRGRVFQDSNVVAALQRASKVPDVVGQLFTTDLEMFPHASDTEMYSDYHNAGLVLSDDALISDKGVRYALRRDTGKDSLRGVVSFTGELPRKDGSRGSFPQREVPLLLVDRDLKSDRTAVIDAPLVHLGDAAVDEVYGLNEITTIENLILRQQAAALRFDARGLF
jgi:hypothetical protein